jgi:hypothetical protein
MIIPYQGVDWDCTFTFAPAERAVYSEGACVEPSQPAEVYIEAVSVNGSADISHLLDQETRDALVDLILESLGEQP